MGFLKEAPFPGVQPYAASDAPNFHGRRREVRDLAALIVANQVVVLYGPGGIGKTSLVNAGVVPRLRERGFEVLPAARVGLRGSLGGSDGPSANPFVQGLLRCLSDHAGYHHDTGSRRIGEWLDSLPRQVDALGWQGPRVLIIDQLEELYSSEPLPGHGPSRVNRAELMCQLAEAVTRDPVLRVLMVIREEYRPALEADAAHFPQHLDTQYRLAPLARDKAVEVLERTALAAGRPFASGVAERIVSALASQAPGGLEEFVDPVALQVMASEIWRCLPDGAHLIEDSVLEGPVEASLQQYYDDVMRQVSAFGHVSEARLREWMEQQLITPAGTRSIVFRGAGETAGMPNHVVDALAEHHLIRGEYRAGAIWYELVHDRLVSAVLRSNAERA
ncbi:MAG TPA: ATP-binding protein [Thermoanaerobaculia bacterium]|jgi:hypothetical protein